MDKFPTPSAFYRKIRPEFFSDSKIITKVVLPREQLDYEISQISVNQKHDSFETLCRRLAEKLITPNLIPQVGPTGGGDGKTDSETYPVSNFISDRWFISDNKWDENENWAFAFSAKKEWKSKVKSDVKSIINTGRGYTKIFFFSSQKISSKNKKETQDQIKLESNVDLIILDAEWIVENVYKNHLINIVIDSLNISTVYREEKEIGLNDADRLEKLKIIEDKIARPKVNFEVDFQLVEDCLESAILSRMLELPRAEVIGKFDRAFKFVFKLKNNQQMIRVHYQKAWTLINWYDDYLEFYNEFLSLKALIQNEPNLENIELYFNLFNILRTISNIEEVQNFVKIEYSLEESEFIQLLKKCVENKEKPSTSLLSEIYISIINLSSKIHEEIDVSEELIQLQYLTERTKNHFDIPFETIKTIVDIFSKVLPESEEFDKLTEILAEIESNRVSEKTSGQTYFSRGIVKLENNLDKESLVFFGKAVRKLAKEETRDEFYFCLLFLGEAYSRLGLYWAAYSSFVGAVNLYANEWFTKGTLNPRFLNGVEKILKNESFIGRIPVILGWYELYRVLKLYFEEDEPEDDEEMPTDNLIDGCLTTRLLNLTYERFENLSFLPDIFVENELWLSGDASLYLLGNEDLINMDESKTNITKDKLPELYNKFANQPFVEQMAYDTNFMNSNEIIFNTKILGVNITIKTVDDYNLVLLTETILAYLESFLATAFKGTFAVSEKIILNVQYGNVNERFLIDNEEKRNINLIIKQTNILDIKEFRNLFDELVIHIIGNNFVFKDYKEFFENLYSKDEVHERLSLVVEHMNFLTNILTNKPKYFLRDWKKSTFKEYSLKRKTNPIKHIESEKVLKKELEDGDKPGINKITHRNIKSITIIENHLWDLARWRAFGFFIMHTVPFGIVISFENEEAAKKIFENWIKEFGNEDINNTISITIIKGIDKDNPHWYKVLISKKINKNEIKNGEFITHTSRFHKMTPDSSKNLDNIIYGFEKYKKYLFVPGYVDDDLKMTPFPELGIWKTELKFIDAWEIGLNDFERSAIIEEDRPIIPKGVKNAPVLEVLKEIKRDI